MKGDRVDGGNENVDEASRLEGFLDYPDSVLEEGLIT